MARKNKKEKDVSESGNSQSVLSHIKEETLRGIIAIIFFVLGIFLVLSAEPIGKAGAAGRLSYSIFHYLFGIGYYLIPLLFFILCVSFFRSLHKKLAVTQTIGGLLFFISALSMINIVVSPSPDGTSSGGVVGRFISTPLISMFEIPVSLIMLFAALVISFLIIFDTQLNFSIVTSLFKKKELSDDELLQVEPTIINPLEQNPAIQNGAKQENGNDKNGTMKKMFGGEDVGNGTGKKEEFGISPLSFNGKEFTPPPLSLLEQDRGKPGVGDIKANSNIIKRTLQNFGINVEMDEISIGPSITRYALKPAEGVKLSRIVALQNDLSLALAAHPIRIEAPIPGKSLVGIEIPNSTKTTVGLGSLLGAPDFQNSEKPLLVCLGKGISGMSYFGNLAKAPHLLIAGATGSGKSVTIHAIITSLLYRNSTDNLKFILALKWAAKEMDRRYDILQAESLQNIESYHKNVVEPEIKKMKNKKSGEEGKQIETMPYIVVVIDELADIMTAYPRELEAAIVRLAQMSRAVGIHLILSTQRPSVNVITGLIKANIPSRIALQVASQIDSRTILDMSGAEKLLGAGDMLYLSGEMSQPRRIQSAFISENETKSVVKYLVESYENEVPNEIDITGGNGSSSGEGSFAGKSMFDSMMDEQKMEDDDELYEDARQTVIEAGKASTSYLQRKLGIGYARAARLVDMLEERGVIGPGSGAKPREVLEGRNDGATSENDYTG